MRGGGGRQETEGKEEREEDTPLYVVLRGPHTLGWPQFLQRSTAWEQLSW